MHLIVHLSHLFAQVIHLDVPGFNRPVDQRRVGALTERIAVLNSGLMHQLAAVFEGADNAFVRVFAELTGKFWHLRGKTGFRIQRIDQFNTRGAANPVIVFPVCRGHMHNAGTVAGADKRVGKHPETVFMIRKVVKQGFITLPCQFTAFDGFEQFVGLGFGEISRNAGFRHDVNRIIGEILHRDILNVRPYTEGEVGR